MSGSRYFFPLDHRNAEWSRMSFVEEDSLPAECPSTRQSLGLPDSSQSRGRAARNGALTEWRGTCGVAEKERAAHAGCDERPKTPNRSVLFCSVLYPYIPYIPALIDCTWMVLVLALGLLSAGGRAADARIDVAAVRAQFPNYHRAIDHAMTEMLKNIESRQPDPGPPAAEQVAPAGEPAAFSSDNLDDVGQSAMPAQSQALEEALNAFADRFWKGRVDSLNGALWRLGRMRPTLDRILAEEGVPTRFAAVVLVESGANPLALSPKDARGLWQIVPDTALHYGLIVTDTRDDRIDIERSTRAAARYLADLYREFGTWPLALAAYNAGAGAVQSAIARGGAWNFQMLSDRKLIPLETRNYVPAVLAAINLLTISGESSAIGLSHIR